jgi:cytochrome oxidase Cu insertion factor (SCO1/SenC/PrrC family)
MHTKAKNTFALAVVLVLLGMAQAGNAEMDPQAEAAAREYFTDTVLINQDGEEVLFFSDVLKDQVVVINFIFTNCGGACPMITEKLRMARESLDEEQANALRFVSISIDPERDSPAAMREFQQTHRATGNWVFLTGEQENLDAVVKRLGQWAPDVEAHSTLVLAGNVNERHWMKIMPSVPPPIIAEQLRTLLTGGEAMSAN